MQLARVVGQAVSTVKHASLKGWRLLIVQPLTPKGTPDGEPLLALDSLGAGRGGLVIISNDGQGARDLVGDKTSPARWFVMGMCDPGAEKSCELRK
jgi:ethanolamine utilization protein EutN